MISLATLPVLLEYRYSSSIFKGYRYRKSSRHVQQQAAACSSSCLQQQQLAAWACILARLGVLILVCMPLACVSTSGVLLWGTVVFFICC